MPSPTEVLGNLDDYGLWLAAVVAGLTALGLIGRRLWRWGSAGGRRLIELGRKIDALDDLARRELTHGPAGVNSTKDYARTAAGHALAIERLEQGHRDHDDRIASLEAWRREHSPWAEGLAERLAELVESHRPTG